VKAGRVVGQEGIPGICGAEFFSGSEGFLFRRVARLRVGSALTAGQAELRGNNDDGCNGDGQRTPDCDCSQIWNPRSCPCTLERDRGAIGGIGQVRT
jgi:hypothetical protein